LRGERRRVAPAEGVAVLWERARVVELAGCGQASRGACAEVGIVVGCARAGGCQAGAGSAWSLAKAAASSPAQGQEACRRSVAVRAWKARRAATCSSR